MSVRHPREPSMNGRYRVTVLAVELYDPLLIQHAISRAGGDGARTGATRYTTCSSSRSRPPAPNPPVSPSSSTATPTAAASMPAATTAGR